MSGVRGDARKRQQESQPAPEVGLTEAERDEWCICPPHLAPMMPGDTHIWSCSETWRRLAERDARINADAIQQERAAWVAKIEALGSEWPTRMFTRADPRSLLSSDATEAGTQ